MSSTELKSVNSAGIKDTFSFCPFCGEKFDEPCETNAGVLHSDGCEKGFYVKRVQ